MLIPKIGELHTESSQDVALGIHQSFPLFGHNVLRDLPHIVPNNMLVLEHYLLSTDDRSLRP